MKKRQLILWFLLSLFVTSCGHQTVYKEPSMHVKKEPVVKLRKPELIVVDAGHGGKDTGTCSKRLDYEEKELALSTAMMLRNYLEFMGYSVLMTRNDDTFIPLETRALIANEAKANLFVSVHYNHSDSESADGVEVFYFDGGADKRKLASKQLGKEALARIIKHTGATSRGVKSANFVVIKKTHMPAILVEGGFLSNTLERERVKTTSYRRFIAYGIARAVDVYLEQKRPRRDSNARPVA